MAQHVVDQRKPSSLDTLERSMGAGYGAIAAILLFSVGGYVLDRWLGTSPWLFILGAVVGVSLAFVSFGGLIQNRMSRR
jgi:F0F1-type ATP synthase assembly protein I